MSNKSKSELYVPAHSSPGRNALWIACASLIYFVVARLSLSLVFEPQGIAAIWPPAGIFLSTILLTRRNLRPWLVGALFITDFTARWQAGTPGLVSLIYALVAAGDAVLGAWLLLRLVGGPITFGRAQETVAWLLLTVVISNSLASLAAALAGVQFLPGASFGVSFKGWVTSDGIGKLVVTPLVLSWAAWAKTWNGVYNLKRVMEAAALAVLLVSLNIVAFYLLAEQGLLFLLLIYLTFLIILWLAFRFEVRGVATALFILVVVVVYFSANWQTAFLVQSPFFDAMTRAQLYLTIVAVPALILAGVVTERQQAGEALLESEGKFKFIFDHSPIGKSLTQPSGEMQVNKMFCEMLGYSPDELRMKRWQEITHPADVELSQKNLNVLYSGEKAVVRFTKRYIKKNGDVLWGDVSTSLRRDAAGEPLYFMTAVVDITEFKHADEALRESEEQLRAVLDATPFPIALTDTRDNHIDFWSRSAQVLFGHTASTAGEWYQTAFPDPDYRQKAIARWRVALERARISNQAVNSGEYQITCSDGTVRICEVYAAYLGDRLVATFNDISERKQVEEALRANQERYRLISTVTSDYMFSSQLDEKGQLSLNWVAGAFEAITGYTFDEYVAHGGWRAALYPDDLAIDDGDIAKLRTNQPVITQVRTITKDGRLVWVRVYAHPLFDAVRGELVGIYGAVQDVTGRVQTENALKESEVLFRTLFEHAPVGVSLTDTRTGRYADVNQKYCDYLGYTKAELLKLTFKDVTDPGDLQPNLDNNLSLIAGKIKEYTIEKRYICKNGETLWARLTVSPLWTTDKQMADFLHIAIVQDISESKRAEAKIAEQLAELRQWYSAMLGREMRVLELKEEVNEVLSRAGLPAKYVDLEQGAADD